VKLSESDWQEGWEGEPSVNRMDSETVKADEEEGIAKVDGV
jgi:hypothetical protein